MDENPLSQSQRDNAAKAVALLTAMDANRSDTTLFAQVAASYVIDSSDPQANLDNAIDLVNGLSMIATALLAMAADASGDSRAEILGKLARLGV